MTHLALAVLLGAVGENRDLRSENVLLDLRGHGAPIGDAIGAPRCENPGRDGLTGLGRNAVHDDTLTFTHPVLLAPEGDHGILSHGHLHY